MCAQAFRSAYMCDAQHLGSSIRHLSGCPSHDIIIVSPFHMNLRFGRHLARPAALYQLVLSPDPHGLSWACQPRTVFVDSGVPIRPPASCNRFPYKMNARRSRLRIGPSAQHWCKTGPRQRPQRDELQRQLQVSVRGAHFAPSLLRSHIRNDTIGNGAKGGEHRTWRLP